MEVRSDDLWRNSRERWLRHQPITSETVASSVYYFTAGSNDRCWGPKHNPAVVWRNTVMHTTPFI